jgi:tripartite-type tricarboxylate transporter receptor subunit TctC
MKKLLVFLITAFSLMAAANSSPIEFVVKAGAGGPDDTLTRKLKDHLEKTTDLSFIVINKPGAAHMIGYNYFQSLDKPALIIGDPNMSLHPVQAVSENIFHLGTFTNILYVRKESNIKNLIDLIALSKTRQVKFGHGGIGTFSHAAADKLCSSILSCIQVPYRSGASGMTDLMGGHIDAFALISYGSDQFINNEKLVTISTYSTIKHPKYDIPTLPNELKHLEIRNWIALFARNMDRVQVEKIKNSLSNLDKSVYVENGLWK